jgi:uncharacterized protein (TIGR03435 family)
MLRLVAICAVASYLGAAAPADPPEFEVASIKPAPQGPGRFDLSNGRVDIRSTFLRNIVASAYGVSWSQVDGAEQILYSRYDIAAKAPAAALPEQINAMLRTLLEKRLKLAVHLQTKEMELTVMTVGKNGAKLQPSHDDGPKETLREPGRLIYKRTTLAALADLLSGGGPETIDRTGLEGPFDITLDYGQYVDPANPRRVQAFIDAVREAIEAQLGLKFSVMKVSRDLLVVDHAELVPEDN